VRRCGCNELLEDTIQWTFEHPYLSHPRINISSKRRLAANTASALYLPALTRGWSVWHTLILNLHAYKSKPRGFTRSMGFLGACLRVYKTL